MGKFLLAVLIIFLNPLLCSAQSDSIKDLVTKHLIDLGKVENGNENFSGFDTLKTILKDVEIVMLGEQTHGEATTIETKIKLIKYLHQEMGFDILAFESGFYDCQKTWNLIEQGWEVDSTLALGVYGLWSLMKEFKPLVEYIENQRESSNPLVVSGFDQSFTGKISKMNYLGDLEDVLDENEL